MKKVFRYKLDFYYQQTLIYLFTLVLYVGIRGSFVEGQFSFVVNDPIIYIIFVFFGSSIVTLFLNIWRQRRLVIEPDRIVFKSRAREREVKLTDIEWMHIGRERLVQTAGRFQQIYIKIKDRRRAFRIRVGRYDHTKELVAEMERIAAAVPKRKRRFIFTES